MRTSACRISYASSSVAKMAQLGTPTRMSDANQLRANGRLPAFVCETATRPRRASARSFFSLLVAISTAVLGGLVTFPFCFCCFCFCSFFCCFLSQRRRRGDWRDFMPCLSCRFIACVGPLGIRSWAMGIGLWSIGQRGVGKRL